MKLLALLLLTGSAHAAYQPFFPHITWGGTYTGASASISVSVYADAVDVSTPVTALYSHGELKEWSLCVVNHGTATAYWTVEVQVSNDDATWTPILSHKRGANASGTMVWAEHRKARRARLAVTTVGGAISATAYASP